MNGFDYKQLAGKELSYNNLVDTESALACVKQFNKPSCVIVKHANPSGVSIDKNSLKSYQSALKCDPISAFGGIVSCNFKINEKLAIELNKIFLEVIISNGFDQKALDDKGINYKIAKSFFNANGRAVASGSTDGFIKILVSDDNLILGAHIIGSNATEMISEFSLAMSNQLTVENILGSVHPHPTFSEAIFETLMQLK